MYFSIKNLYFLKSTEDCGTKVGCYLFPNNCKNKDCILVFKWKLLSDNNTHEFKISAKLDNPNDPNWVAVGFSNDAFMVLKKI